MMDDHSEHPANIDPFDVKLIRELETDPRQSYTNLAAKLGVTGATVRNRMQSLLDARILRVVCYVDPVAVGYSYGVIFGIVTQPDKSLQVAEKVSACAPVDFVMLCAGRFGIIAHAVLRTQEDLLHFLSNDLNPIPGILQIEPLVVLDTVKSITSLLSDGKTFRLTKAPVKNLDSIDLALMARLQKNALTKTSDLVRELQLSKATVLRRVQRLEHTGIIRFAAEADPFALGYKGVASIHMKFDPVCIEEAARVIASHRNVAYVAITTGRSDIVASALFREFSDLRHFLVDELAKAPGLKETETMINLKVLKFSYQFLKDHVWPGQPEME